MTDKDEELPQSVLLDVFPGVLRFDPQVRYCTLTLMTPHDQCDTAYMPAASASVEMDAGQLRALKRAIDDMLLVITGREKLLEKREGTTQ